MKKPIEQIGVAVIESASGVWNYCPELALATAAAVKPS